ncbi:hypothetical protein JXO59_03635 [candidate division KSB1 bacterium]|nr:hypothetical protein [candidate division KSB1 bacterium]
MHIWVLYETRLGNTAYVAKAIASALSTSNRVQLMEAQNAVMPSHVDIIFIGYPSHRGRSPEAILSWLTKLPYNALKGIWFTTFDIRYRRFRLFPRSGVSKHMIKLLQQLGGKKVSAHKSFYLLGKGGPISDAEIRRSVRWVHSIEQLLSLMSTVDALPDNHDKSVMFSHSSQ